MPLKSSIKVDGKWFPFPTDYHSTITNLSVHHPPTMKYGSISSKKPMLKYSNSTWTSPWKQKLPTPCMISLVHPPESSTSKIQIKINCGIIWSMHAKSNFPSVAPSSNTGIPINTPKPCFKAGSSNTRGQNSKQSKWEIKIQTNFSPYPTTILSKDTKVFQSPKLMTMHHMCTKQPKIQPLRESALEYRSRNLPITLCKSTPLLEIHFQWKGEPTTTLQLNAKYSTTTISWKLINSVANTDLFPKI